MTGRTEVAITISEHIPHDQMICIGSMRHALVSSNAVTRNGLQPVGSKNSSMSAEVDDWR